MRASHALTCLRSQCKNSSSQLRNTVNRARSITTTPLKADQHPSTNSAKDLNSLQQTYSTVNESDHKPRNTSKSDELPLVNSLSNPSSPHDSLSAYLAYTKKHNSSRTSTTYLGTQYEYLVQQYLTKTQGFKLNRVGGRNDSGIDLLGSWNVLSKTRADKSGHGSGGGATIPILIQCKRVSRPTPTLIRELEGSFLAAPAEWNRNGAPVQTLGMMVCTRPATKGIRDAMARSRRGLAWVMLEEDSSLDRADNGSLAYDAELGVPRLRFRQFLWNGAATEACGLGGLSVGLRYAPDDVDEKEVNLLWQGKPVDFSK